MHENYTIRRGKREDLDSIFSIERKVFGDNHWSLNMVKSELVNTPYGITWVLLKSKIIVAYCMTQNFDRDIHIINMAVAPGIQGVGVGKMLIEHLLNTIPYKSSVFLEVKKGNFPAINLYSSFGFDKIGIRKKYYRDGSDAVVMCLRN